MLYLWLVLSALHVGEPATCEVGDISVASYLALDDAQQDEVVEHYVAGFRTAFEETDEALRSATRNTAFLVESRLKEVANLQEKIERAGRHYSCFNQVTDIAGVRIVVPDYAGLPYVIDAVHGEFEIVEEQYRINDPGPLGYRAVHYLVRVEGHIAEIQIHTLRGTLWANASHVLFYKGPYRDSSVVETYLKELSDAIYLLDSGIYTTLPPIPANVPSGAKVILEHAATQIDRVTHLDPLEFFRDGNASPDERAEARSDRAAATVQELRFFERSLLEEAGLEADQALMDAFASTEHYALDDFGQLSYDWQAKRKR